jgi:hypothetical protein
MHDARQSGLHADPLLVLQGRHGHAAFAIGPDDKHIATVDESGVALAAIQGFNQKVEEQRAENVELKRELSEIKQLLVQLTDKKD